MKKNNKKRTANPDYFKYEPIKVKPVKLKASEIDSEFELEKGKRLFAFGVNRDFLPQIKSKGDLLILAAHQEPTFGEPVIVQHYETKEYLCGTLAQDDFTEVYFFKDAAAENAFPIPLSELIYCGEVIGFCPLSAELGLTENKLKFSRFAGK